MASFPLYDTFFIIILPRKVHYLFSYFEKSGKKIGHPQKSCFTPPLRGGGGGRGVQAYNFGNFNFEIRVEREGQDMSRVF